MSHHKEYLHLHFIVILWGFTAILGLLITMPVLEMVFLRTVIATLALGLIVHGRKLEMNFSRRELFKVIATGVLFAGHWLLFFGAAREANASVALVGYATATFWISLLEPVIARSRINKMEVVLGIIVMFGIYIIFQSDFNSALGLAMAIGCGFLAGIYAILNKQFTVKHNHLVLTYLEMFGAAIFIGVFLPIFALLIKPEYELSIMPTPMDWVYLLILSLVCTVYTISTSIKIMKKLSAYAVSLTLNLEPVYGIILALLIFGDSEKMQTGFYIGSAIIIASVLGYPVANRGKRISV